MELASIAAHLFSALVIGLVGLRLLTGGRIRRAPERWLGMSFLATFSAYIVIFSAVATPDVPDATRIWLGELGSFGGGLAGICLLGFLQVVFRPADRWGSLLFWTGALLISGARIADPFRLAWPEIDMGHPLYWAEAGANLLPSTWMLVESLLAVQRQRRRRALGLADAVVANRFALFGVFAALRFGMNVAYVLATRHYLLHETTDPGLDVVIAACSSLSAAALLLALAPPRFYRSWVARSAST